MKRFGILCNKNIREILYKAAINLFYNKGYLNTSFRAIGRKAHISMSNLYHYFKNKEDLATRKFNNYELDADKGRRLLAEIAVKNNYDGSFNPKAHSNNKLKAE
jgi:DNA-binding transcriptional regulator YbjK